MPSDECQVAVIRRVPASTGAVTLTSPSFGRKGFIVHNDSTAVLYVKYGTGATVTDFTHRLDPQSSLEHRSGRIYFGLVTGVWDAEVGAAQVTELL